MISFRESYIVCFKFKIFFVYMKVMLLIGVFWVKILDGKMDIEFVVDCYRFSFDM